MVEYKVITSGEFPDTPLLNGQIERRLNYLSADGWRLVAVSQDGEGDVLHYMQRTIGALGGIVE